MIFIKTDEIDVKKMYNSINSYRKLLLINSLI